MEQTYSIEMPSADMATGIGICAFVAYFVLMALCLALAVLIYTKLASKAGYPWAMGLLVFIPIVNFVIMLIYVFSKWPIEKELEMLRRNQSGEMSGPQGAPPVTGDFRNV